MRTAERKRDSAQPQLAERKRDSAQPQLAERKRDSAQPQLAERKRDSAQPQLAERKRDSAQPQLAERKRDSAQPQVWLAAAAMALAMALAGPTTAHAQQRGGAAPKSARDAAPIDLTGYWVSYVTENWRYRMVTPAKGEYRRIPASPAAVPLINAWDPAADERAGNQCKSYGAGNIMSVPGRLHITWQDADTLRIDTDAGTQIRLFHFSQGASATASPTSPRPRSWQGESTATWEPATGPGIGGSLRIVTSNLLGGYLRKNGVPYSERATVTEHFDIASLPDGSRLLLVTTIVEDPVYLTGPYVVSPHFKKEADGSKWDPTPCSSTW